MCPQTRPLSANLPLVVTEGEFKGLSLWRLAWESAGDTADAPAFLPCGLILCFSRIGEQNNASPHLRVETKVSALTARLFPPESDLAAGL